MDESADCIIVGGGIAGLYAAKQLTDRGHKGVRVLEVKDVLGGRIETGDLDGFEDDGSRAPMFKAEYGPMRFELDIEPLFTALCTELGLRDEFVEFSPATPGTSPISYPLFRDECRPNGETLDPLNLLRLGVYRMVGQDTRSLETTGDVKPLDDAWLNALHDGSGSSSFDELRKTATFRARYDGRLLRHMGFWNALHGVLSPGAVSKILNEGTFYHLMPENPNAIEWAVFWLRLFKDASLYQLPQGVRQVTEKLAERLASHPETTLRIDTNQRVVGLKLSDDPEFVDIDVLDLSKAHPQPYTIRSRHVVLALPKQQLLRLAQNFSDDIRRSIDAVIAFPLLKVFLTIRTPLWWERLPSVQEGAWLVPTREIHWFGQEGTPAGTLSPNAMALLYTDRPATSFWRELLSDPERHDRAERGNNPELKRTLVGWLVDFHREWAKARLPTANSVKWDPIDPVIAILNQLMQSFPELEQTLPATWSLNRIWGDPSWLAVVTYQSVCDYAVRDWANEPFGAGCHAWKPGVESWDVRTRLASFGLPGSPVANLHVCGEAYSDYQGFIEGALRSTVDALTIITL